MCFHLPAITAVRDACLYTTVLPQAMTIITVSFWFFSFILQVQIRLVLSDFFLLCKEKYVLIIDLFDFDLH